MEKNVLKQNQKYFSRIGIRYLIGTIIIIALQMGFTKLCQYAAPEFYEKYAFLIAMLPMYVVAVPIMILIMRQIPVERPIEKKKIRMGTFLGYFLVAYAGMYVANILGIALTSVIAVVKGSTVNNAMTQIATTNDIWMNFLVMVICAPIAEEILFRKLLVDRTRQYGEKFAVILSGVMFGFYHGNINQFCYAFVLGCVFAYVYIKTGNVIYTIILHMMMNFFGSIVSVLVIKASGLMALMDGSIMDPKEMTAFMTSHIGGLAIFGLYFLCIMGLVIGGIVIFGVNFKKITFEAGTEVIEKKQIFKTVVLNIGMGAFFLFWTGFIIYATVM